MTNNNNKMIFHCLVNPTDDGDTDNADNTDNTDNINKKDNIEFMYETNHILGITSYHVKQYQQGYNACNKAIKMKACEVDINNIEYYKKKIA